MRPIRSLCVFCGSSDGIHQKYKDIGAEFGRMLAARNLRLVYGGGSGGVMGAVADAAMKGGAHVTGVFPTALRSVEREHLHLSEFIVVESMHERKLGMYERADAFVVFPGGWGLWTRCSRS